MRRNGLLITTALASVLGGLCGACSIEDTPHAPTYTLDIQPLVLSRCVRCHGAGGHLHGDPDALGIYKNFPPVDGYFNEFNDQNCEGDAGASANCKHGMFFYATNPVKLSMLNTFIHSTTDNRMPPPPAPALTSSQIKIFDTWLAESPPQE